MDSITLFVLLSHWVSWMKLLNGQTMTADGCYQVWPNSKVNCMNSFKRSSVASEQQCREMCTQNSPRCKAAQFATSSRQCDLFDTFIPPGSSGRRKRDDLMSLIRSKRAGVYAGSYRPSYQYQAQPAYRPQPQPQAYRPQPQPQAYRPQPQPQAYRPQYQPQYQPPPPPKPSYGPAPAASGGGCYGPTVQPIGGYSYCKPATCVQTTPRPTTPAPQACPAGQVLRYYSAPGYKLQGNPDSSFTATDEQACIQACTNNQQPGGTAAMCKSADFNTQTRQCQIYASQSFPPNGTGAPQQDENYKHYEKICVDASLARCQGPFFLGPQMILIGYAQSVTTASSQAECLALCVNAQSRFGFNCLSGMFYYQETTNNCILNSESRSTHPDLYNPETQDRVSYFEPACQSSRFARQSLKKYRNRNVIQLDQPDFGAWTMCDHIILDHKRFKSCSTFNPNKCNRDENICDPKKEDEYDLQIVHPVKPTTKPPQSGTTKSPGNSGNGGSNGNGGGGSSNGGSSNSGNSSNWTSSSWTSSSWSSSGGGQTGGGASSGTSNGGNSGGGSSNGNNGGNSNGNNGNGGNSNGNNGNGGNSNGNNGNGGNSNGNNGNGGNSNGNNGNGGNPNGNNGNNGNGNSNNGNSNSDKSNNSTKNKPRKEEILIQARDSGTGTTKKPPFVPFLPPGRCATLIKEDGTPDCENGIMFDSSGNRKPCKPEKDAKGKC